MKLYQHYKNKPYEYIDIVKHSETLEEMVLYRTRYENPNGELWVRPKKMFFETVDKDGKTIPRFQHIPLELKKIEHVGEIEIKIIGRLMEKIFGSWNIGDFHSTFKNHVKFFLIFAYVNGEAVGFKLGYEKEKDQFYSWLGGVLFEYRGLGIADEMMAAQHDWCRQVGYTEVQTKTQNKYRDMFVLNLKHGFEVIGVHNSSNTNGELKIILRKKLT